MTAKSIVRPVFKLGRFYVAFSAACALMLFSSWTGSLFAQSVANTTNCFQSLFNGRDLTGWTALETQDPRAFAALSDVEREKLIADGNVAMQKYWRVEGGAIVNDGEGPYLTTLKHYTDFELWVDYCTVPQADSGIYLKATPQVQIWDTTKEGGKWEIGADKGSGGLWNNSPGAPGKDPSVLADNPFGHWNRVRIIQVGARTSVWLNGKLVVDHALMENYWDRALPLTVSGPIQLQTHGGRISWSNICIREISPSEANQYLACKGLDGFEVAFNGVDLTNWQGAIDGFEVINGSVKCKPGHGGNLFTAQEYGDFTVRLEFKLPAAGNNGLAIRYPGSGDSAYEGMCELQVLDSEHANYAGLDSRQYHGSAYGMVAAHRGYLRPTGTWNFQEVTVRGSTIRVELNGNLILDCDLNNVNEYLGGSPHSGKTRTSGHFGFCGHNDPVEFRNVWIKRLN